jgi:hypothetical protein
VCNSSPSLCKLSVLKEQRDVAFPAFSKICHHAMTEALAKLCNFVGQVAENSPSIRSTIASPPFTLVGLLTNATSDLVSHSTRITSECEMMALASLLFDSGSYLYTNREEWVQFLSMLAITNQSKEVGPPFVVPDQYWRICNLLVGAVRSESPKRWSPNPDTPSI